MVCSLCINIYTDEQYAKANTIDDDDDDEDDGAVDDDDDEKNVRWKLATTPFMCMRCHHMHAHTFSCIIQHSKLKAAKMCPLHIIACMHMNFWLRLFARDDNNARAYMDIVSISLRVYLRECTEKKKQQKTENNKWKRERDKTKYQVCERGDCDCWYNVADDDTTVYKINGIIQLNCVFCESVSSCLLSDDDDDDRDGGGGDDGRRAV